MTDIKKLKSLRYKIKSNNIYYRDNKLYCIHKTYDNYLIMSEGTEFYADSMTVITRILVSKSELKNFIKVEPDKLDQYDFLIHIADMYSGCYRVRNRPTPSNKKYDFIIDRAPWNEDPIDSEKWLENKYNLLRNLKLERILNG